MVQCDPNGCTLVAEDDSADLYVPTDESFVDWGFSVQGNWLTVTWDGQLVFSEQIQGLSGPGLVGLYSNDNDGGVIYDNFLCAYKPIISSTVLKNADRQLYCSSIRPSLYLR